MQNHSTVFYIANSVLVASCCIIFGGGCLKPPSQERVAKERTDKEGIGHWTSYRGRVGQSRTQKYMLDGEEFEGLWEVTNPLGGRAKLQLKLPPEWDHAKVYQAAEIVFRDEADQPWYYPIEDTFLPLVRQAMASAEEQRGQKEASLGDITPDMPYECTVRVAKRDYQWLVEFRATLRPDQGALQQF